MLTRTEKQRQAEQLRESLARISSLYVVENRGLTVNEVNELRSKIREISATYKVYKNSVVRMAVEGTQLEELARGLTGPNAFAFTDGDPVQLAKVLREFIKEHERLTFKAAYVDGTLIPAERVPEIADLPTREELLTQLVFMLQSPIRRLVTALAAPVQQLVTALAQVAEQVAEKNENQD